MCPSSFFQALNGLTRSTPRRRSKTKVLLIRVYSVCKAYINYILILIIIIIILIMCPSPFFQALDAINSSQTIRAAVLATFGTDRFTISNVKVRFIRMLIRKYIQLKVATRVAASTPPPKHLDILKGAPLRLSQPLSDQFPVRVCSCPLCIINRL